MSCSEVWVGAQDRSWAKFLSDAGYDVWMGNNRGNIYSRGHRFLDPEVDDEFFDFSFHELGAFDMPAMIDYVREYTGQDKIAYIGYSQGSVQMFSALSENRGEL